MSRRQTGTRYTVTGAAPVLGHLPSQTFVAQLEPTHEARLVAAGSLSIGTRRNRPRRPAGATTPRTRVGGNTPGGER